MPKIVYDNPIHERIYNHIVWPLNAHLKLPAHHNATYFNREIIELTVYTALEKQYIESSVKQLSLFIDRVPSADIVFHRLNRTNWRYILNAMKDINDMVFSRWKNKPKESVYLAVDFHEVPRHIRKVRKWRKRKKRCDDVERVVGTQAKRGTHYGHRIASIDIVEEQRFTLGFDPVFSDTDVEELIISLIENVKPKVSIKAVLFDRGFFNGLLIDKLKVWGIPYIIRAGRRPFVKKAIKYTKQKNLPYYVEEYVINKNTHRKGRRPVSTTLVIVDNAVLEAIDPCLYDDDNERFFAFVTNLKVETKEDAFKLATDYRKRWGIETGYRTKEDFLAKTCSLSYAVRLFFILLSFVLSNVWWLINSAFKDEKEFVKIFKNHIPTHMIKVIFWMVLIIHWSNDRG